MYAVEGTHKELAFLIRQAWHDKVPLFTWGAVGIGKSMVVRAEAKRLAEKENREFVVWNELLESVKVKVIEKPIDYFVLLDKRLLQSDASDIIGTPGQKGEYTKWLPDRFVHFMSQEHSMGVLFLDEFNLAPTMVQNVAQQLLLDRAVGDVAISKDWLILGAGNRSEDKVFIHEMSGSVANRYRHFELTSPGPISWSDWAIENGLDGRVVSFLRSPLGAGKLSKFDPRADEKAFASPRSWEFVSKSIMGVKDENKIRLLSSSCIGVALTIEFQAFIKLQERVHSIKDVLDGKERVPQEAQLCFSVMGGIAEFYREFKNERTFDKIVRLCVNNVMEREYQVLLLKMIKKMDKRTFGTIARKSSSFQKLAPELTKLLV